MAMKIEELLAMGLTAENAQAILAKINVAEPKQRGLTLKVQREAKTDKETGEIKAASGAVSLYGLGRFPVTLYKQQWIRLLAESDKIKAFLDDPNEQNGMSQEKK